MRVPEHATGQTLDKMINTPKREKIASTAGTGRFGGVLAEISDRKLSLLATSRFWPRFQASCQARFFSSCVLTIQNRPNHRGMYPTAAKALGRCYCRLGALAPGACNEHTSKTCEIDNALNPFGSWLLEKRCKLGSTASLASTTSQH